MSIFANYNIDRYIKSVEELNIVTLESILAHFTACKKYSLSHEVSAYLKYIETTPFYVAPTFQKITTEKKSSSLNARFLLFSAPGATGKSALAKYLSNKYNGLYWDLSKLKLGTNSFAGSILKAVGPVQYSNFISDLAFSRSMIIIDAFDEAEIISGRKMLSTFISDIQQNISAISPGSPVNHPNIILLARTETAQFLASDCTEQDISFQHYEVGFFEDFQAKEFIKQFISLPNKQLTPADEDCATAYFNAIKQKISEAESRSFLGYAPVLEAIARHIQGCQNRAKLINALDDQKSSTDIIITIMRTLLSREQTDKVIPAFKQRCLESHPEFTSWDNLYSEEEQLVRIISYLLWGDCAYSTYPIESLPPYLVDDYQDILNQFLKQHPFIQQTFEGNASNSILDFTGPAFRDYALAWLILQPTQETLVHLYFDESQSDMYFPSQIFFDCYTQMAEYKIHSKHLPYVYDSYRAKAAGLDRPYMQCSELCPDSLHSAAYYTVLFSMMVQNESESSCVECEIIVDNNSLYFDQVTNISVDVPSLYVQIGSNSVESRIFNSSIVCRSINFSASRVSIEAYRPENCLLICSEDFLGKPPIFDLVGDGEFKINSTNIQTYYKLIPYKYNLEDNTTIDITKFTHALRCIMMEFRTHKKDTLAKAAERIEYVTVGNSDFKRQVLEYLLDRGIIYLSGNLYKINSSKMQGVGISYASLSRMRIDNMSKAFEDFVSFTQ